MKELFKKNTISILCPTHKRVDQLKLMIESAWETAKNPKDIQFCLYIDNDDLSYQKLLIEFSHLPINILKGPKMWLSSMFNSLLTISTGELLLYCGDDVIFRTKNWDEILQNVFKKSTDKLMVAHVNDGANYEQCWATIGIVHQNWIKLFGYLLTPQIPDNGIDAWITHVANQSKRRVYLSEILLEHMQYRQDKSSIDDTYKQRLHDHKKYNPLMLYKNLDEARRRDSLVLASTLNQFPLPISIDYFLTDIFLRIYIFINQGKFDLEKMIFLSSMKNFTFLKYILSKIGLPTVPKKWY